MPSEAIQLSTLPNGVRVVSETASHVQSLSLGIWVDAGSVDEPAGVRGISHFIEHMLFKGTGKRNAQQIAEAIESRGGSLNAFTDKECTCFYVKSLAEDAEVAMDVLSDMLIASRLDPGELALERNVVLEEIKRYEDTPDDIIHDVFTQTLWKRHPLGRPVLGTSRTVAELDDVAVRAYMAENYTPDRIVVAAAGNVPHERIVELASQMLGGQTGASRRKSRKPPHVSRLSKSVRKKTEQVHFCLGGDGAGQHDARRFPLTILDMVLGGNMSSRLFQEIREKRGLAYSIGSYLTVFQDCGYFTVYGGTSPETYDEVLELVHVELAKVREQGLTPDEVQKAKNQVRGSLILGLEGMSARMMRLGKSILSFGYVPLLDEYAAHINAVTVEDVQQVAAAGLDPDGLTTTAIGPFARLAAAEEAA